MTNSGFKQARLRKGYTQEQLAELVGVSQSTITSYENGLRSPSPSAFRRLMQVLDLELVEAFEMFYGDGEDGDPGDV